MTRSGSGVILHNASIDASGGDGPYAAYNASKAGLLGLNRTLALELATHGIRSNCVSPGFTHTVMAEKSVGPELLEYLSGSFARVPIRRLIRPEEVAQAFLFLVRGVTAAWNRCPGIRGMRGQSDLRPRPRQVLDVFRVDDRWHRNTCQEVHHLLCRPDRKLGQAGR